MLLTCRFRPFKNVMRIFVILRLLQLLAGFPLRTICLFKPIQNEVFQVPPHRPFAVFSLSCPYRCYLIAHCLQRQNPDSVYLKALIKPSSAAHHQSRCTEDLNLLKTDVKSSISDAQNIQVTMSRTVRYNISTSMLSTRALIPGFRSSSLVSCVLCTRSLMKEILKSVVIWSLRPILCTFRANPPAVMIRCPHKCYIYEKKNHVIDFYATREISD